MRAILLTGSNAPDRESILRLTASLLAERVGPVVACSQIYSSAAWGFHSDEPFANQALMVSTDFSPEQLLDEALSVEQIVGRDRTEEQRQKSLTGERYASRVVDVDILLCDQMVISTDRLQVPHPLLHEREFALEPLCEIAAEWLHPLLHSTIEDIYKDLKSRRTMSE